ncbi:poly(ADP-ribose) glycohydrolase domain-containing protein [Fournierella sp.]|uniref:poly(ADP-ribose) glycohydrolase domain-containing protein n=1 Tax=Allofournierella sp. TaxID=1940256 RepID=UPI00342B34F7
MHPNCIPGSGSAGSRKIRQSGCRIKVASATNPDGGIPSGRSAQEEALCRCSPLSLCLLKDTL